DISAAEESRLITGAHILLVSDRPTGHQGGQTGELGPEPAGEGFHPEFQNRAPALRNPEIPTRVYEYPPLPATVEGLDLQPSGGVGAYQMRIDYGAAGGHLLNQASWAAQPTWYRWEVWRVREEADARAQEQSVRTAPMVQENDPEGSGRVVDRSEGSDRNWARARRDLAARPGEIRRDFTEAVREDRYLDALANVLNERLFDLESAARYGREILNTAADTFGTDRERQIPWQRPGLYVVRCIAVMNPRAEPATHLRAPSVATRVVRVMPLADLTRQAIDSQELEIARLQAHAALLRTLPADDPSRNYLPDIEARIARIERESRGSPAMVVAEQLAEAIRKRDEAVAASIFLRHGLHDPEVNRWNALVSRLTAQQELIGTRAAEISELGSAARRARAAFVSGVTGQMYPLLFQIGEPVLRDGTWVCMLSDVTDPDSRPYRGEVRNVAGREQEKKLRAVWEAVERWVRAAPFGAGNLLVQLPTGGQPGNWFASLGAADRERRLVVTSTRDRFATTQRLEELATLLAILGLLVTAPEIALAAGALGAAVAANRLVTRISEGTFRWDTSAVGDVLNIVSAFATGIRLVGALERVERAGGWVIRVARTAERVEQAADVGNLIIINADTVNTFLEIEEAVRQGLSETEARRRRFHAIASAAQGNGMFIAARARSAMVTRMTSRPRRP
ncbi:MAG TPA: hypothetical protein VJ817_15895, partial [Gemmatimonadales bacterium]|nr:hypothetical protein [Gemmatimonadales bacterium]